MKYLKKSIMQKLIAVLLVLSSTMYVAIAQIKTNLTNVLGIGDDDLIATMTTSPFNFGVCRSKLNPADNSINGDCFVITARFETADFSSLTNGQKKVVYTFRLYPTSTSTTFSPIYQIGVVKVDSDLRWYVRRYVSLSTFGKNIILDYEVYDDIGVTGNLTFIFGHHFTAIASNAANGNYRMAPVFFGMDSNIGTFANHMGEFTGETSNGTKREVTFLNTSYVWKMNGNALINNVITKLQANNEKIINARTAGANDEGELQTVPMTQPLISAVKLYPNPTSGRLNVEYSLKEDGPVTVNIFNLMGQNMFTQTNHQLTKGNHKFTFDGAGKLAPGIYVLKLTTSGYTESIRFTVE